MNFYTNKSLYTANMEIPPYRRHSISGKTRTINLGNMELPAFRGNLPSNPGKLREQAPSENSSDLDLFGPLQAENKNRTSVSQSIAPARPINSGIRHFLEEEPAMPVYSGPAPNSVKIKPMDKDFGFNGVNIPIEKFILRYEDAGSTDDEVEEMSGYKDGNWEELKRITNAGSRDGGHILPDSATLMTYIQKELQSASLMERRHQLREVERQRTCSRSAPPGDKTMDDLSKQLSSWNVQKPTPFISSSHVPHKKLEKDYSTYTCHYCGAKGHSLHRCNSQTTDEIKKLCRKEGANIVMPDGTRLPFDKNTPYKVAVDKWHAERKQPGIIKLPPGLHTQQMEQNIFQSSFGELEFLDYTEESGSTYDCDVGRELKNKEKVQETPSAKEIRQEQEDSMDEEQGVMDKLNLPDIDYGTPEPRRILPWKRYKSKHQKISA
ncbi:hypothetical protein PSHT_10179 [Puccinia striiformis]|uniref:CCHC-type domain-containing protein n=1 Tax=Puccinia striiformis TaxID=27350 RepID=A0A2S4VBH7_9BASI|nr:hypothetical protein PSHT_10179 [Puccinia striiformis]